MEDTIFFTRASLPPFEEYIEEIRDCWETRWITTMGPKHALFEQQLKSNDVVTLALYRRVFPLPPQQSDN